MPTEWTSQYNIRRFKLISKYVILWILELPVIFAIYEGEDKR